MELKEVYELWDRFESSTATKFELEISGAKICIERQQTLANNVAAKEVLLGESSTKEASASEIKTKAEANKKSFEEETPFAEVMKAPLVGTFYCAPAADAQPFVKEGKRVKQGEVIGIIEAMKLMNEITAPFDGVISKILVENEQFVSYEEPLFEIEKI